MKDKNLILILQAAGGIQILMALGSTVLPRIMNWKTELIKAPKLFRQMFWVYAGYILITNIWMGVLSILAPKELITSSRLSLFLLGYMFLYWFARVLIQWFYFDKNEVPKKWIFKAGELGLNLVFIVLTAIYGWTFYAICLN